MNDSKYLWKTVSLLRGVVWAWSIMQSRAYFKEYEEPCTQSLFVCRMYAYSMRWIIRFGEILQKVAFVWYGPDRQYSNSEWAILNAYLMSTAFFCCFSWLEPDVDLQHRFITDNTSLQVVWTGSRLQWKASLKVDEILSVQLQSNLAPCLFVRADSGFFITDLRKK